MKNKIMGTGIKIFVFTGFFYISGIAVYAQNLSMSDYGLPVIKNDSQYLKSLTGHPEKQMVSVSGIPGVILDLRYASENNFMHKKLYPENIHTTFLRKVVYQALNRVAIDLARRGLVLVIFDAYRPYSVTEAIWVNVKDERYAANPAKGSGHNRGISVDLTLADAKTHQLLPMPTGFDNFSDTAHQGYKGIDNKRISNRELLKRVMMKYGFVPLQTEWWHFSWPGSEYYELMDLGFEELSSLQSK